MIESFEKRNGEPPVVLRGLHKSFGAQVVLNGIDLTVAPVKRSRCSAAVVPARVFC